MEKRTHFFSMRACGKTITHETPFEEAIGHFLQLKENYVMSCLIRKYIYKKKEYERFKKPPNQKEIVNFLYNRFKQNIWRELPVSHMTKIQLMIHAEKNNITIRKSWKREKMIKEIHEEKEKRHNNKMIILLDKKIKKVTGVCEKMPIDCLHIISDYYGSYRFLTFHDCSFKNSYSRTEEIIQNYYKDHEFLTSCDRARIRCGVIYNKIHIFKDIFMTEIIDKRKLENLRIQMFQEIGLFEKDDKDTVEKLQMLSSFSMKKLYKKIYMESLMFDKKAIINRKNGKILYIPENIENWKKVLKIANLDLESFDSIVSYIAEVLAVEGRLVLSFHHPHL